MERQLMKWKKIFAYHISDNGLIFKVYKEHITPRQKKKKKKKTNNLILNGQRIWRDIFQIRYTIGQKLHDHH